MSSAPRPRFAVDLGTTWTAAARDDGQAVALGERGAAMPSVIALGDNGFVVGGAAERVLATNPERGVREIKRRFGDTTPVVLDGRPFTPDALTVELLRGATSAAGVDPAAATAVLTHPANWGEYKLELLRNVATQAGFADVELISEPAAAARHYAASGRLHEGDTVAVYDFGGGTFDAVVIRLTAAGPVQLGAPQGLERLGGIDIDQVVFSHVATALGGALTALDRNDPDVRRAILALRAECTVAKEQLSADGEATVNVVAPGLTTQVRITRDELEAALRPRIADTVASLQRAVAAAELSVGDLAGIVLVGGSARIPLVAEMVEAATGRPLLLDGDMKLVVVQGAVRGSGPASPGAASPAAASAVAAASVVATVPTATVPESPSTTAAAAHLDTKETPMSDATSHDGSTPQSGAIPPPPPPPSKKDEDKGSVSAATLIGGAAVAAAAVAGGVLYGDDIVEAVTGDDGGSDDTPVDLGDTRTADRAAREAGDETMDAFDEVAAPPVVPPPPAAPVADFGGNGGGGGGGNNGGGGGGGGGQQHSPRQESAPAPRDRSPEPAAEPQADAAFEDARATLLDRIDHLDLGAGVDADDVEALKNQLRDTVDRFQPAPGQSAEDALADLRAQYDERVQDFTQDQKIEALIDEQMRDDDATDPATEPAIDPATGLPIVTDGTEADPADPTTDPTATPEIDPATGLPMATDPTTTDPTTTDPTTTDPTADPTATDGTTPDPAVTLPPMGAETTFPTDPTEPMADPDDGGEVAEPGNTGVVPPGLIIDPAPINPNIDVNINPDITINPDIAINPNISVAIDDGALVKPVLDLSSQVATEVGDMVAADPDDGGEVAGGLFDDFESAVGTFQEQASTIDMPFGDDVDLGAVVGQATAPATDLLGSGEDLFGEGFTLDGREPGVYVPDLQPLADDAGTIAGAVADGDLGGVVDGVQSGVEDYLGALDESVELPFEPQLDEFRDDVADEVNDFADDPVEAVSDVADEFEGTVSGIADDIGL